jgi:hypothetical protein
MGQVMNRDDAFLLVMPHLCELRESRASASISAERERLRSEIREAVQGNQWHTVVRVALELSRFEAGVR